MEIEPSKRVEYFKFTGQAGEYFGIWFVNHTLTWMTLGIYSAWAKVRTLQYFYGNTQIGGGHFQFTAKPTTILRSRIIAALLLLLYIVSDAVGSQLGMIVAGIFVVAYFALMPILLVMVMSFRARYSEWRGIKFRFHKDFKGGYFVYLLPVALVGLIGLSLLLPMNSITVEHFFNIERHAEILQHEEGAEEAENPLGISEPESTEDLSSSEAGELEYSDEYADYQDEYSDDEYDEEDPEESYINPYFFIPTGLLTLLFFILLPYFDFISTRYLVRNVHLGTAPFVFHANITHYYKIYIGLGLGLLALAALWVLNAVLGLSLTIPLGILSVLAIPGVNAYLKSKRFNTLLNNTKVDNKHQFLAETTVGGVFLLLITNSLMIAITFGFMTAWAKVRTANYFLTHLALEVDDSLDHFVASQQQEVSAMGEELADVFDIDII